ncbi:MAG: N-acetylneuraminate synthase family protein [Anaerolineae bacterium]|nr:N-acetylneuraminate synthase family protein [Anaerolineae bacterium]
MTTIIAEFCQNHKGDKAIIKDMIAAAAAAGADYAKIQSILADDLTFRDRFEEGVVEDGVRKAIKRPYQPEYERLKPMDVDDEAHRWFIEECEAAGIKPLTTVFARSRVPFVGSLPWRAVKVASYDCSSLPLLNDLKERFDHLFISTGATFDHEIKAAADTLEGHSFSFLHCVTIYPTPLSELHLRRMEFLRQFSPSVGYSDHSLVARDGNKASMIAILLGADVVERHFTVLPADATKDGPVSVNPQQLAELAAFARASKDEQKHIVADLVGDYSETLGEATRPLSDAELLNRDYYRGRFASKVNGKVIYNWEDKSLE